MHFEGHHYMYVEHLNQRDALTVEEGCMCITLCLNPRLYLNAFWCNNSWLCFLKILTYVPKEREKFSAKNAPSFLTVNCCDGSQELF